MTGRCLLLLLLLLASCRTTDTKVAVHPVPKARPEPVEPVEPERVEPPAPLPALPIEPDEPPEAKEFGERLAAEARRFLEEGLVEVEGVRFAMRCSELVHAALTALGCTEGPSGGLGKGGTANIHAWCEGQGYLHSGVPMAGDLVIFDDTYDRNGNRRNDDPLTHIGVVTGVEEDGTVIFVHVGSGRVRESRMNLARPGAHRDSKGNVLNDYVRAQGKKDRKGTRYLAGELFRDYCRLPGCSGT